MKKKQPIPSWEALACYMVDHCEGEMVTEENIQRWASKMLVNPKYATVIDPLVHELESTIRDYEEITEDHNGLVCDLDVLLNGTNAAKQASLCDIVSQLRVTEIGKCKVISLRIVPDDSERVYYLTNVNINENGVIVGNVADGDWAFVYEPETQQLKCCNYEWRYPQEWCDDDGEWVVDERNPVTVHTAKLQWSVDIPTEHSKNSTAAFEYAETVIAKVKNESQWCITTAGVTVYTYPNENIEHDANNLVYTPCNVIKG